MSNLSLGQFVQSIKEADTSTNLKIESSGFQDDSSDVHHPKAIGNILKMIQSDKDKFYEEPDEENTEVTIFTADHTAKTQSYDYIDYGEPSEKKQKEVEVFYCDLCNISCTSQVVLDTHLIGKKHMKNLRKLQNNTNAFPQSKPVGPRFAGQVAVIQDKLFEVAEKEPIVGLQYVTEYQFPDKSREPRYFCELCEYKATQQEILLHIVRQKHRLRYMRSHCFDIYYKITSYPSFSNIMKPSEAIELLRRHSAFVVRTKKGNIGRVKIKQYDGEENMRIDTTRYERMGSIHPSQHSDLVQAELLLEEAAGQEKQEEAEKYDRREQLQRQIREKQIALKRHLRQPLPSSGVPGNSPIFSKFPRRSNVSFPGSLEMGGLVGGHGSRRGNLISLVGPDMHGGGAIGMDGANYSSAIHNPDGQFRLTPGKTDRLKKLKQQQTRIQNALKTLQESSGINGRTREEEVAFQKLRKVLQNVQMEQRRLLSGFPGRPSGLGLPKAGQGAISDPSTLRNNFRVGSGAFTADQPSSSRWPNKMQGRQGADSMSLEQSIQTARRKVEQKIYDALSKGALTPLADAFMNNPDLQMVLKNWEHRQMGDAKNGHSSGGSSASGWLPRGAPAGYSSADFHDSNSSLGPMRGRRRQIESLGEEFQSARQIPLIATMPRQSLLGARPGPQAPHRRQPY